MQTQLWKYEFCRFLVTASTVWCLLFEHTVSHTLRALSGVACVSQVLA
jgi:hypothetical protein